MECGYDYIFDIRMMAEEKGLHMAKRVFTEEERDEYREKMLPEQARPNLQNEKEVGARFLQWIDGVRSDANIAVAANLIKIYVLGAEGRDMLHEVAYEETMERMRDAIIYEIFGHLE